MLTPDVSSMSESTIALADDINDLATSDFPYVPEDVADDIITNSKRLLDENLVRLAFNRNDYEVAREHTSRPLSIAISKNGVNCKSC